MEGDTEEREKTDTKLVKESERCRWKERNVGEEWGGKNEMKE